MSGLWMSMGVCRGRVDWVDGVGSHGEERASQSVRRHGTLDESLEAIDAIVSIAGGIDRMHFFVAGSGSRETPYLVYTRVWLYAVVAADQSTTQSDDGVTQKVPEFANPVSHCLLKQYEIEAELGGSMGL